MKITMAYPDFQTLIGSSCKVMESSDIGQEVVTGGGDGPMFMLTADKKALTILTTVRGLEIVSAVEINSCEEEGSITFNPFLLRRMNVKASEISLESSTKSLKIRAGRFKTDISLTQDHKLKRYEEVELTHEVPAKLLIDSLDATQIQTSKEGRPFSRVLWDAKGLRVWAHNSYNAAYSVVLDDPSDTPFDCILPTTLLRTVASLLPKQNVKIGVNRSALRIKNDLMDCSHPLHSAISLEDIETVLGGLDVDSMPSFEVESRHLLDKLASVGSIDRVSAGTPQSGVDLWVVPEKTRLVVAVKTPTGHTTDRVKIQNIRNMPEDMQVRLNHRQLAEFVSRVKGQNLRISLPSDRALLWAGTTTYMMSFVQEE